MDEVISPAPSTRPGSRRSPSPADRGEQSEHRAEIEHDRRRGRLDHGDRPVAEHEARAEPDDPDGDEQIVDAVAAVDLELTDDEIARLTEPYSPHEVVGFR